ncbi:collagen-binding domain-containing protein, partial [Lactobacillus helveticus]|nr:hypothetical protein [Lactobacillus helveticus]MCT3433341.1 hypothetical protein [Lactobacillus helveticus]
MTRTIAHKRLVVGEKKQRFGFRKTILGLCGAILGSTLLMVNVANNANTVHAAESDPGQAKSVQSDDSADKEVAQTKAGAAKDNGANTDASKDSAKTPVEAKGNEGTNTANGLNGKAGQPLAKKEVPQLDSSLKQDEKAGAAKDNGANTDASKASAKTPVEAKDNEGTNTANGLNGKAGQPLAKKEVPQLDSSLKQDEKAGADKGATGTGADKSGATGAGKGTQGTGTGADKGAQGDKSADVAGKYVPNQNQVTTHSKDTHSKVTGKTDSTSASSASDTKSVFQLLMALSSNSVQPATSISDDTYLKNLGIDINDLNTNSVLKLASLFHIFANQASLSADTNGNLAVKILNGSNDFGTRGDSYNLTSGDIYYIQQLAKHLQSNAFRNKTSNHVVLGKDVNVSIENNKVLINGITMDNLKPEDVYQDTNGRTYIDFSDVFQQLVKASTSYASTPQSKGVISNYDDMNNRYVDVSKVATGTQIIYVNVPFKYLSAPQPITIKGISQEENGPTIVINVTDIPNGDQNISTQVQLDYDDGTNSLPNSEGHSEPNHVLWNLGTGEQVFNFSSGRFMGSVLTPNATINAGVNIDGNIVANIVNITGGESHRWDIHPQPTKPAPTITTEKKTVNETIHYVYKDGSKAVDDHVA